MDHSDCFHVKPNSHGEKATYSRVSFTAGEVVYLVQGEATNERTRESIEVGPHEHVYDAYAVFINHSFDPTVEVRGREIIALTDIAPGEEITFNYLASESEIASPFVCHETGQAVNSETRQAKP